MSETLPDIPKFAPGQGLHSPFLFTVCQPGAELALKQEIAREHPELRFAYSRPGFVTFKSQAEAGVTPDLELMSVFARTYGMSLGRILDPSLEGQARKLRDWAERNQGPLSPTGTPIRLHIWERDDYVAGDAPPGANLGARKAALQDELVHPLFELPGPAQVGELVLDAISIDEKELWVGCHRHVAGRWAHAGGKPEIKLPADAPSRAYVKLEEGILWSGAPLRPGDSALEIGSAPGGAVYSLLKRGLRVTGIDPGAMAPSVFAFGRDRFTHLDRSVNEVGPRSLPTALDWLLLDMNAEPSVTLPFAERIARAKSESLLGVLLTLKLNRWDLAEQIPDWLEQVRSWGISRVRATQLPSNKQEIFLCGLTRRGLARRTNG